MKIIELKKSVTYSNDLDAEKLRARLAESGTLMINIMSSPGSGKTSLVSRLISDLKDKLSIAVLEADIASDVDAEKVEALGARAIQAHTDGMCHMDAGMTQAALDEMGFEDTDLVLLENVGNLICPAEFDTGSHVNLMILSVPEGDDKPLKYPLMFEKSDILVISKTDALPFFNFSIEDCKKRVRMLNKDIKIYPVSAKTGEGMDELEKEITDRLEALKGE
ncbi:MAG: hydrogenase nickel incorporation protein HypB [Clostridiales bacterium]|nr:hydrogenase nickel incorporation protein HypB [Clostridiales bacterium]